MFEFVGIPQYQRWSGFKLSKMKSKSSRSRAEKVRTGEVTVTSELFQFSSRLVPKWLSSDVRWLSTRLIRLV